MKKPRGHYATLRSLRSRSAYCAMVGKELINHTLHINTCMTLYLISGPCPPFENWQRGKTRITTCINLTGRHYSVDWTTGLDYWTHGKCLWRIKEQNFRAPKSLATLSTALQVVQFIQGQLRYVYKRDSYRCVVSVRVPDRAERKMWPQNCTTPISTTANCGAVLIMKIRLPALDFSFLELQNGAMLWLCQ